MMKNDVFKGVLYVGLGATSFGMLATFVKLAYAEGYTTAEVTLSQILLGLLGMAIVFAIRKGTGTKPLAKATLKNKVQLIIAGTSMGFTSVFYYMSVTYIPVSIAIVLLMQTVWMGVILEWIITKTVPSIKKIIAVAIVLSGTVLAANLSNVDALPNWQGLVWGLLAAASFTATMFSGNKIATHLPTAQRSLFMLMGGTTVVLCFTAITWPGQFNFSIFFSWGIFLAVFGTILPPLLLNAGFPKAGLGLGSIVSSLELPVSVSMAYFILNETVSPLQWLGIALILSAVVLMNINTRSKQ
ncbi:permease [Flavobacterium subsaxonicum WB 4.1-42 = DSM 21790]|uniref:Permease n=2 Tax=Flavobacterium TaxID=237 RepID=A0A0A2MPK8_9FLAO|nr:DMT family transporter [Flavobacterium subsaxonicum]KGO93418.1 permease [Flavobacterium subsaxonicum WB 4.1-42 = DSM 21790]